MSVDTLEQTAVEQRSAGATGLAIFDTDIHHTVRSPADLNPYLPKVYQHPRSDFGFSGSGMSYGNNGGVKGYRADTLEDGKAPSGGGVNAVDPERVRWQLLDACGISLGLLTGGGGAQSGVDPDYANARNRAFNDFTIEHWLATDARFRFAMTVNSQDPEEAAKEIDRVGDHPGIVSIILPCGAPRAYGHRFYRPIHEACARHGLAISLHFGGEGSATNPAPTAAGYPSYYIQGRLARPSFYQVHLSSFIFEGVFERFPTLKVALLESGFAWAPAYIWRMDADWKGLRHQTPWVKRLPSEYVRDHIRFGSQPMDEPEPPEALLDIVRWMAAERTLIFATDYPHWDWDDPAQSFKTLPADLRRRIFWENALETFGR
jgi:uncharacterized protein